jgi:hypothetical protein
VTDPPTTHATDEQLSAMLDELPDDAAARSAEHLAGGCAPCDDRLTALRMARAAVAAATVPPLRADVLDRLVGAALEAQGKNADAEVVPIGAGRKRLFAAPPPAWLVGVAAALVALIGVAGLLRATGSGRDAGNLSVAASRNEDKAAESSTDSAAAGASVSALATGAPDPEQVSADLADQSDPSALTTLLRDRAAAQGATTTAFSARQSGAGATAGGATSADAAAEAAPAAPAEAGGAAKAADRAQCRAAAERVAAGDVADLASTATLRWKGEPAEVLVFRLASPPADGSVSLRALVLGRPSCRLLADLRL